MNRIESEKRTVERMVRLYCRNNHNSASDLCDRCAELLDYSHHRLSKCPHGDKKPTCRRCDTHCYSPTMRQQIRMVMAWAGPRMILHHSVDAIRHLFREFS